MTPEEARANAARRAAEARRTQGVRTPEMQANRERALAGDVYMGPERGFISEETAAMPPMNRVESLASGMAQGYTASAADEMALGNRDAVLSGNAAAREQHPGWELTGRVIGGVSSPINKIFGPINTLRGAVRVGTAYGAIDGFMGGDGGIKERAVGAVDDAALGGLFGGLGAAATKLTGGMGRFVQSAFKKADERPTIESLRAAKNAAYQAVRKSGVSFDGDEMTALNQRLARKAKTVRFELDPELPDDKAALSLLSSIEKRAAQPNMTLNKLDQYRQRAFDQYSRTDNPFFLEIVGEIDETISRAAEGNDLIRAARAANSKYAKTQLLENAFKKAELQTAATGSGGNILNKYRQAVTRIITTPREAKWFSEEELKLMESFVMGDNAENALRRVGKLAPGGNGLMTALNVYAAAVDPAMLAVTGAASAAKAGADRSAMQGSQRLLDAVSTGIVPEPNPRLNLAPSATGGAALGGGVR